MTPWTMMLSAVLVATASPAMAQTMPDPPKWAMDQAAANIACMPTADSPPRYASKRTGACAPVPSCAAGEVFFSNEERCVTASPAGANSLQCISFIVRMLPTLRADAEGKPANSRESQIVDMLRSHMMMHADRGRTSGIAGNKSPLGTEMLAMGAAKAQTQAWQAPMVDNCAK